MLYSVCCACCIVLRCCSDGYRHVLFIKLWYLCWCVVVRDGMGVCCASSLRFALNGVAILGMHIVDYAIGHDKSTT